MPISHAHLRSFHAVATHGSFTRASEMLHITQPTLSGQVKELEERYGMPDDVVQEIIRVRYEYAEELGKYHAALKMYPKNPYPIGVPEEWIHPGVKKAMQALNIPMP